MTPEVEARHRQLMLQHTNPPLLHPVRRPGADRVHLAAGGQPRAACGVKRSDGWVRMTEFPAKHRCRACFAVAAGIRIAADLAVACRDALQELDRARVRVDRLERQARDAKDTA